MNSSTPDPDNNLDKYLKSQYKAAQQSVDSDINLEHKIIQRLHQKSATQLKQPYRPWVAFACSLALAVLFIKWYEFHNASNSVQFYTYASVETVKEAEKPDFIKQIEADIALNKRNTVAMTTQLRQQISELAKEYLNNPSQYTYSKLARWTSTNAGGELEFCKTAQTFQYANMIISQNLPNNLFAQQQWVEVIFNTRGEIIGIKPDSIQQCPS